MNIEAKETILQSSSITSMETDTEIALEKLRAARMPHDLVQRVSCRKRWYSRTSNHRFNVVAVDCGM
ncbi:MAG: hypothetical protein II042_02815, partial [Erysipelotrichaceae bacterium]|nr:hypothetical protein [Erysipelotrichaceae bacterium]